MPISKGKIIFYYTTERWILCLKPFSKPVIEEVRPLTFNAFIERYVLVAVILFFSVCVLSHTLHAASFVFFLKSHEYVFTPIQLEVFLPGLSVGLIWWA